jgi:hypothetical protein
MPPASPNRHCQTSPTRHGQTALTSDVVQDITLGWSDMTGLSVREGLELHD